MAPLDGERARHGEHARLGAGRRQREGRSGPRVGRRGSRRSAPGALRAEQVSSDRERAGDGAVEHGAHDRVEAVRAQVLRQREEVAGGVVDEPVELSEAPDGVREERLDPLGLPDVGGEDIATSPPSRAAAAISCDAVSRRSRWRPAIVTFAPCDANVFAIASPRPEPPPVTRMDRSASVRGSKVTACLRFFRYLSNHATARRTMSRWCSGSLDVVALVRVDHQLRVDAERLQRVPELVALRRRDLRVPVAVQHEGRRLHLLDELDRRGPRVDGGVVVHGGAEEGEHPRVDLVLAVVAAPVGDARARPPPPRTGSSA